jgi:dTDP-4-amino-4,6-dideoxygalactose transaminase
MTLPRFTGNFTQQRPIPAAGIEAALAVMRSGRLHRYNVAAGEEAEAAALEREFAAWQGARHALALASGGQAMQIALRAAGIRPGDRVLTNAFTLAPVPGAIAALGAAPVLVEIGEDLVIDLADLAARAPASGARVLLLSNMRGHLCDMDALMALAARLDLRVIEDCAHTMAAEWAGRKSGSFGLAGCFSTQTYKHMNSGEGGFLTSDDAEFMARAILLSGSYMLYDRHGAAPGPETFDAVRLETPNMSARMDNLRAALLRPQLAALDATAAEWILRHDRMREGLAGHPAIRLPDHRPEVRHVGSSVQFRVPALDAGGCDALVADLAARGVEVKWFGADTPRGFTSNHHSWHYVAAQDLPQTDAILSTLFDMRLPLTFSLDDCTLLAAHIREAVDAATRRSRAVA